MRVRVLSMWCMWACSLALCSLSTVVCLGQAAGLEAPTGVAVCQEGYGNSGRLRVSWTNPEMYEAAQLFVDGESAALVDGADGEGVVHAPPGDHVFGVRGLIVFGVGALVGAIASEVTSVEFRVLEESPVPEPITDLDCEFIPAMGGLLRVTWSLGNDPWVRGRLGFPGARGGVDIEAGATEIEVLASSMLGGNEVVLVFKNEAGYSSPPFVTDCERRTPRFRRSDCDGTGRVNITDPIFQLNHLFRNGPRGACDDACDANNDGRLDVSDAVYTLNYLFDSGPPPPSPGPMECGIDDDPDGQQDFLGGVCTCPEAPA